jgi:hypothetical protein
MKKLTASKHYCILVLSIFIFSQNINAQETSLSRSEFTEDLNFLKKDLLLNHPNLYTYSSPEEVDSWFTTSVRSLPDSISHQQAYLIVSSISSVIKDGHSYIYPSAKHLDYFFKSAPLFPFEVFLDKQGLIVTQSFTEDPTIPLNSKLISVNGHKVQSILGELLKGSARDGNNLSYPEHVVYKFFPASYSFRFGFTDQYIIEYSDAPGRITKVIVDGLQRDEIRQRRAQMNQHKGKGITLNIEKDKSFAVLAVPSFDKSVLQKDYQQKFKKEVKKAFKRLEEEGIQYLAIDLRDNQGGALSNGIFLLQHFMTVPFQSVHSYYKVKTSRNGKRIEKQLTSKWDNFFKPKKANHFDGEVFMFANGGSYSCSSIVANTFTFNKRGTIIGSMTGGSSFVNSGAPNKLSTLPNSKILVTIPKTKYQLRENLNKIGDGVEPNIKVKDTPFRYPHLSDTYITVLKETIKK